MSHQALVMMRSKISHIVVYRLWQYPLIWYLIGNGELSIQVVHDNSEVKNEGVYTRAPGVGRKDGDAQRATLIKAPKVSHVSESLRLKMVAGVFN